MPRGRGIRPDAEELDMSGGQYPGDPISGSQPAGGAQITPYWTVAGVHDLDLAADRNGGYACR
jgi:hypothetical protein